MIFPLIKESTLPFEDAAGEFNNWKYPQFWEPFEAPQPPILGEHESKSPKVDAAGELFRNIVRKVESSNVIDFGVIRAPGASIFTSFL